jgi:hypothetical protein
MKSINAFLFVITATLFWPSQAVSHQQSDLCSDVMIPVMEQVGLDVSTYGPVLGCELSGSEWQTRTVSDVLPGKHSDLLDERGIDILTSVDRMSMSETFSNSVRFERTDATVLTAGAGGSVNSTSIANEPLGVAPTWLHNYTDAYANSMEVYLLNNAGSEGELVDYMEWFVFRRDATLQTMSNNMNPMAQAAFLANWGYMQWPWHWQLADPVAIAAYVQSLPTSSLPTEPSTQDQPETQAGTQLRLNPDSLTARPGDTILIEVQYPRLQGVHAVAFLVFAERMAVWNVPMSDIDMSGEGACSVGHFEDPVQPIDRATDLNTTFDFPPTHLELVVDSTARSGDQLAVCVEMVGFASGQELFSWNARADVSIVE